VSFLLAQLAATDRRAPHRPPRPTRSSWLRFAEAAGRARARSGELGRARASSDALGRARASPAPLGRNRRGSGRDSRRGGGIAVWSGSDPSGTGQAGRGARDCAAGCQSRTFANVSSNQGVPQLDEFRDVSLSVIPPLSNEIRERLLEVYQTLGRQKTKTSLKGTIKTDNGALKLNPLYYSKRSRINYEQNR